METDNGEKSTPKVQQAFEMMSDINSNIKNIFFLCWRTVANILNEPNHYLIISSAPLFQVSAVADE